MALVTGAGLEIGETIARRFAAAGVLVQTTRLHDENTQRTAEAFREAGGHRLDVADPAAEVAVMRVAVEVSGSFDILVANSALAGSAAHIGPLLEVAAEQWQRIVDVNLSGVFSSAREAARATVSRGSGCIITVDSVSSFVPKAGRAGLCRVEGRRVQMNKGLARDLGPTGNRVNGIAQGGTDTQRTVKRFRRSSPARTNWRAGYQLGGGRRPRSSPPSKPSSPPTTHPASTTGRRLSTAGCCVWRG